MEILKIIDDYEQVFEVFGRNMIHFDRLEQVLTISANAQRWKMTDSFPVNLDSWVLMPHDI